MVKKTKQSFFDNKIQEIAFEEQETLETHELGQETKTFSIKNDSLQ